MLNGSHPLSIVVLLGLVVYALYRQSVTSEVATGRRFTLPALYAVIGIILSRSNWPGSSAGWAVLGLGLALSIVVGILRGRLTRVWADPGESRVLRRGTPVSIGLYVALVAAKVAITLIAVSLGVAVGSGIGEILIVVAVSLALQSEIVYRRSRRLTTATHEPR